LHHLAQKENHLAKWGIRAGGKPLKNMEESGGGKIQVNRSTQMGVVGFRFRKLKEEKEGWRKNA